MTLLHCEAHNGYLIAIYSDDQTECPLDWDQVYKASSPTAKTFGRPVAENARGVYWITFEKGSILKNYHHFSSADAALKYARQNNYHVFALHGYCPRRGYNADYEVRPLADEWYAHLNRVAILGEDHEDVQDNVPEVHEISCSMQQVGFVLVHYSEFPQYENTRAMELATNVTESVTKWCNGTYAGFEIFQPTEDNCEPHPPSGAVFNAFNPFDPHDYAEEWEVAHSLGDASVWGFESADDALKEARSIIDAHMSKLHTPKGEDTCSGANTDHAKQ